YAPYSGFRVGAALVCDDGTVFCGCNVESASYGATICAERSALSAAVAAGKRAFTAILITGDREEFVTPCGICRQALAEFGDMDVYCANCRGEYMKARLSELLPYSFKLKTGKTRECECTERDL
ncbi:MAG TPA: cytidine deaminase, partial [Clostridia bacterium]|nr:cytidine deaminase [Clostridia bacterium]